MSQECVHLRLQERFLIDTPDKTADPTTAWPVAITYTTEASKDFDDLTPVAWCTEPPSTGGGCVVSAPRDAGWFVFNVQSAGD
jgi:hypothetical protein